MGKKIIVPDKVCDHCQANFNRSVSPAGRLEGIEDFRIRRYCSTFCYWKHNTGENNANYKDGFRRGHDWGYLRRTNGKYVHREVVEQRMGRPLAAFEHVHHVDGNVLNNQIDNLLIVTNSEHRRLHAAEQKRDEAGRFGH